MYGDFPDGFPAETSIAIPMAAPHPRRQVDANESDAKGGVKHQRS